MHLSQPYFKMCEGTIPAEKLYDECKYDTADMDSSNPSILSSDEGAKDEKYYPEEMKNDNDICSDSVEHLSHPIITENVTVISGNPSALLSSAGRVLSPQVSAWCY